MRCWRSSWTRREKYAYGFRHQQATTSRRRLPVGDYAVAIDDEIVAAVERKTVDDLAGSLLVGQTDATRWPS